MAFLRQADAGLSIKELRRSGGFIDTTFYKWRAMFGGMQVSEAQRLRELVSEKAKLKRLLAEAYPFLDRHPLKSVLGGKALAERGAFIEQELAGGTAAHRTSCEFPSSFNRRQGGKSGS